MGESVTFSKKMERQVIELPEVEFTHYRERWHVLVTVAALNIGINTLLYSYSPVGVDAAQYFGKTPTDINTFTTVGLVCSTLVALIATWLVDHIGLRYTLLLAGVLSFSGGFLRMIVTFPGLNDSIDKDVQYWITLIGQALNGLANPLAFCLPTKVAVDWFPENEAPLASGLITMSFVLGLAIATGLTPIFFSDIDLIQWMNIAWFVPAALAFLCTVFLVRRDKPETPPTHSAIARENSVRLTFYQKLRKLFRNRNFLVLLIGVGGMIGYNQALISTLPQITCSAGYSSEFTGLCVTLLLFCGVLGGTASSFLYRHTGRIEEQAKVSYAMMALLSMPILYLVVTPEEEILLAFLFSLNGLVALGLMPLGAELTLENTYPVDPAAGMSLIFCVSQLMSILVIELSNFLVDDLDAEGMEVQVCINEDGQGVFEPKDHSAYVMFIMVIVSLVSVFFIVGLKSEYRRRNADTLGKSRSASSLATPRKKFSVEDNGSANGIVIDFSANGTDGKADKEGGMVKSKTAIF